jgi:hypothetical protein
MHRNGYLLFKVAAISVALLLKNSDDLLRWWTETNETFKCKNFHRIEILNIIKRKM